jgi:hypothetical protein
MTYHPRCGNTQLISPEEWIEERTVASPQQILGYFQKRPTIFVMSFILDRGCNPYTFAMGTDFILGVKKLIFMEKFFDVPDYE